MYRLTQSVFFGCLLLIGWSCEKEVPKQGALSDFIPENAQLVFTISNLDRLQADIANSSLFGTFNETTPYSFFAEEAEILQHLLPTSESILAINHRNDINTEYTFITKETPGLFTPDSLSNKTIETLSYNNSSMQRVEINNKIVFTTIKDSVFIACSSQALLQDILDDRVQKTKAFRKVFNMDSTSDLKTFIRSDAAPFTDSLLVNFATWTALQTNIFPDGITATGVALANDSIPQLLSVFEGQNPQQHDIENITPREAKSVIAFTLSDPEKFITTLSQFNGNSEIPTANGLFDSANELGVLSFATGKAVVLKSIDPALTNESLALFTAEKETYREVVLKEFNAPALFAETFSPLIDKVETKVAFQLDNFFVFTETDGIAQQIITAHKNNDCLNKTPYFKTTSSELSNASSLLVFKMKHEIATSVANFFGSKAAPEIANTPLKNYPLAAIQFSYDRNFAHVNLVCKEASEKIQTKGSVVQQFSLELDAAVLGEPQFFSNHRTQGKDIVVQDMTNKLHLISSNGKVVWKNKLDGPILGAIQEVDLLKNGRKQLAFTTENTFYILDRNGKNVAPFPLKFRDKITQPLAVFDYDKKRNYRFVITQGDAVFMYNNKAQLVKGFTFKKAKSRLVLPPQHIRLGNKDYIAIAERNGTLNLLNRVGKHRVRTKEQFKFSSIPVQKEGNNFVVLTADNHKKSISQSGKVSSRVLDVSGTYFFTIAGKTKISLDDNLLRIKGKLLELPFGIYTAPATFFANTKLYITVTETQENKIYVYNSSGDLLPGFPVYGTAPAEVGNTATKGLQLVTKGASNEILLYGIQ